LLIDFDWFGLEMEKPATPEEKRTWLTGGVVKRANKSKPVGVIVRLPMKALCGGKALVLSK
jgi:hypothetical protein